MVALPDTWASRAAARGAPWRAWGTLRPVELAWFALLGLAYGLTDLGSLADVADAAQRWRVAARLLGVPLLVALLLIPFWLPAARSAAPHPQRLGRLALAAALGAALAMALLWPLVRWLELPSAGELIRPAKGLPMFSPWHWGTYAGDCLTVFIPAFLAFVLFDLVERRHDSMRRLQQAVVEHHRLAREAMAARLAALQAQVEPQFLFDTLVDIERAYASGDAAAPERLERLIHHLRVALPRLRDAATTLASEAELLRSWLAVAGDRLGAPVAFVADVPPALAASPLPPMLLLPLLQGALQRAQGGAPPRQVALHADAHARGWQLRLGLDRAGLCPAPELLQALAERARTMGAGAVSLACVDDAGHTTFTLQLARR